MSKAWKQTPILTYKAKLKNRRVIVGLCRDGSFIFRFVKLQEGNAIAKTLRLSEEATTALAEGVLKLMGTFKNWEKEND